MKQNKERADEEKKQQIEIRICKRCKNNNKNKKIQAQLDFFANEQISIIFQSSNKENK